MYNFVTACINADALLEEIDDYILQWHEADTDLPVYDFLGMTEEEYMLWLKDDSYLKYIILAHKKNVPVTELIRAYHSPKTAARAENPDEAHKNYPLMLKPSQDEDTEEPEDYDDPIEERMVIVCCFQQGCAA